MDGTWDTTRFRSLQAHRTGAINLAPLPRPGDLRLSMLHIADLMDNVGGGVPSTLKRYPFVD